MTPADTPGPFPPAAPLVVGELTGQGLAALPEGGVSPADVPTALASDPGAMERIARNFAAVAGIGLLAKLVGLATGVYARRVLGPTVSGMLNWNGALLGYVGLLCNPGVLVIARREAVHHPDRAGTLYADRRTTQLLLAVPALAIAGAVAWHLHGQPPRGLLLVLQSAPLLVGAFAVDWLFEARERMVLPNAVNLLALFAQVPLLLLLVRSPADAPWFVVYPILSQLLVTLCLVRIARRDGVLPRATARWSPRAFWPVFSQGLPVTLSSAAIMLYYNCDVFFLGLYSDLDTVGQYGTAYSTMLLVSSVITPMWTAFLPRVTASITDEPQARALSRRLYRGMALAGGTFALFGFVFGRDLVRLAYGPAFGRAGELFAWLSLNAIFLGVNTALSSPFTVWNRQRLMLWMTLCCAGLNLAANALLIPRYGVWAAVWTTLGAEAFAFGYSCLARRRLVPFDVAGQTLRVLTPLALLAAAATLVRHTGRVPWGATFVLTLGAAALVVAWLEPGVARRVRAVVRA